MRLSRRSFLAGGGALVAGGLLAGCGPLGGPRPPAAWGEAAAPTWRALSRLTFGPLPEELARAGEIGLEGWVEEQLAPQTIADGECELRLQRLETPFADISLLNELRPESIGPDLRAATLLRAVYSRRQLHELMVEFWGDHFSVSIEKERVGPLKVIDDREVMRAHALGSFADLLWASMSSPAMLIYLDNQRNLAASPNENYARELLELHTLGVDAGYTQADVREVARCLTGWTVDEEGLWRGRQQFAPEQHDDGPKLVLGQAIPAGGGAGDVSRLHELVLAHPATPRFIARKLVRRLVADDPPPRLVEAVAATFARTGGQIAELLRTILYSPEFAAAPPKYKRPLHLVAGALRQLGADSDGGAPLQAALAAMGQPLFGWPTPDGFPDRTAAWSASLLPRWQFALALARGELPGTTLDLGGLLAAGGATGMPGWVGRASALLLGAPLPAPAAGRLAGALGAELTDEAAALALAGILAAPHYQWR